MTLTRRMTGRIAARAGAVAFAKAVAKAGGAGISAANAASTPALAHTAAAPAASPASGNQASSNCPIYEKGHAQSFQYFGGGNLYMLGDCHGKVAAKVVTNQPSDPYNAAGAVIWNYNDDIFHSCTVSPSGSQYACVTPFVPAPYGRAKAWLGNANGEFAYIQDNNGQFNYSG